MPAPCVSARPKAVLCKLHAALRRLCTLYVLHALGILCTLGMLALPAAAHERAVNGGALVVPRNVQFVHVTTANGLSQQFVQAVVQDADGQMWFGTQEGLNRYDGHDVQVYQHDPRRQGALSNNFVWSLFVDRAGALWVGTESGLNRYDARTDTFSQPFAGFGGANGFGTPRVRAIAQDRRGVYWIGTVDGGLLAVDPVARSVRRWAMPPAPVMAVLVDVQDRVWVGTDGAGLARIDAARRGVTRYLHREADAASLSDDQIRALHQDRQGRVWVGTATGGLNLYDARRDTFVNFAQGNAPLALAPGQVPAIMEDHEGVLWVGTESGVCEFNAQHRGFVCYRHDALDPSSLVSNRVNTLFEDRSGVLWLGTYGGVSRWNRASATFSYYRAANGTLSADVVTSVAEARDRSLWIGTYGGGLTRIDRAHGRTEHFRHDPADAASLSDDRVMAVFVDVDDTVWVGTRSGGLERFDAARRRFVHHRHDPANPRSLSGDAITSLGADALGRLWIGVFDGGLNRMRLDGGFDRFRHDPARADSLSSDRVLAIHCDRTGTLWVGTEQGGINRYDPTRDAFVRIGLQGDDGPREGRAARQPVTAWDITEDSRGALWIATMGEGLYRWSAEDRARGRAHFTRFRRANGLPSDTVYGVLEGAPGALWLSSSRGLSLLDLGTGRVRDFDQRNGLRGNEFNLGARLRGRDGHLYFGSTDGLVVFHAGAAPGNRHAPQVSVTALAHDRRLARARDADGSAMPRVELGYLDPFVAFEFVGYDYVSPDKNRYRYRLEGLDVDWVDAGRFRRAVYSRLPAGDYVFHVQAANNDGVWNPRAASIAVHVEPPPWASRGAYAAYLVAALLFAFAVWRAQRLRAMNRAQAQARLETLVAERTHELAARNDDLQRLNAQLAEASVTDSLTGLRNRRYLDQSMQAETARLERRLAEWAGGVPDAATDGSDSSRLMFFMMIDLDGFKAINDTHGHAAGDEALLQVKDVLLECSRQSDVVIRWGGDEFMVVGHVSSFQGAKVLAERVRVGIGGHDFVVAGGEHCRMSASIGLAPFPIRGDVPGLCRWEQVAAVADQCAYMAKSKGRDAWVSIMGTPKTRAADLVDVCGDLARRIAEGRLVLDSSLPAERLLLTAADDRALDVV